MNKLMILALIASSVAVVNAEELQSFMGIRFGMKISEGNFSGPDEKGDYTFLPPGAKANPKVRYRVSSTQRSKRIWKVAVDKIFDVGQGDFARSQTLAILKRDYGTQWEYIKPEREEWREVYDALNDAASGTARKDDFFLFWFKNSQGDVCQVMHMMVIRGEHYEAVSVLVMDMKVLQQDDEERKSTKVSEQKKETKVQTPDSFLGYTFGSDVEQCATGLYYVKRDGHVEGYGSMKKPFRKFTGCTEIPEHAVYLEGCVTSRRLYKISVTTTGVPPRESVSIEDMMKEFRATCDVITKKYGVSYKVERKAVVYRNIAQGAVGKVICEAKFLVGKVRISLKLLDSICMYRLLLEATNEEIEHDAKKEIEDSLRVAGDGMDAL